MICYPEDFENPYLNCKKHFEDFEKAYKKIFEKNKQNRKKFKKKIVYLQQQNNF